jgi:VCBS repeat-containing protein
MAYQMTVAQMLEQVAQSLSATNKMTTFKLVKTSNATSNGASQLTFAAVGAVFAIGGEGNEFNIVTGGIGNDTLSGGNGFDIIIGGAGNDTVDYSYLNEGTLGVQVDLARRAATVSEGDVDILSGIENVKGSKNDDILKGNSGDNIFISGGGHDIVDGRGGSDILVLTGRAEDWRIVVNSTSAYDEDGFITLTNGTDSVKFRNIEILRFTEVSEDGLVREFAVGGETSGGTDLGAGTVIARDDGNDGNAATVSDNTNVAINVAEEGSVSANLIQNDTVINNTETDAVVTGVTASATGIFGPSASNSFGTLRVGSVAGEVTFAADGAASDALALGQTATTTFFYQVEGGDTAQVTFTVTGTNDQPSITGVTSTDGSNSVTEDSGTSPLTDTVSVAFNDVDVRDTHSVEITGTSSVRTEAGAASSTLGTTTTGTDATAGGLPNTLGTLTVVTGSLNSTTTASTGSVTLVYTVDNANPAVQALGAGDTITETFSVRINDGQAASNSFSAPQIITFTITGTNDGATIAGNAPGAVAEDGGDNVGPLAAEVVFGTLTVTDVDSGENVFATVDASALAGTYGNFTFDSTTGEWTYTLRNGDANVQALREGFTVRDTLDVKSLDGTAMERISVTITGDNDRPTVAASSGSVVEDAGNLVDTATSTTGSFTVADIDVGDILSVTSGTATVAGTGIAAADLPSGLAATLASGLTLTSAPVSVGDGEVAPSGTVNWTFTLPAGAADFLAFGQSLTLTIPVTATDDSGSDNAAGTANITITITGTNDAPVIDSTAAIRTIDESNVALSAMGQVTFSDVDTGDTPAASYSATTGAAITADGITLTSAQQSAIANGFSVDAVGNWSFSLPSPDYLAFGDTVTAAFTVVVTDDSGVAVSQPVTITIRGTNDAPTISDISLVQNGSFEMPDVPAPFGVIDNLPGWSIATAPGTTPAGVVELVQDGESGLFTPFGDQWLDLRNSPGGVSITQAVAGIQEGTEYNLSFSIANRSSGPQSVEVFWGGLSQGVFELAPSPLGPDANSFTTRSLTVSGGTGNGTNTLTFRAANPVEGGGNQGLALDNITVSASANQTLTEDEERTGPEAAGSFRVADVDSGDVLTASSSLVSSLGNTASLTAADLAMLQGGFSVNPTDPANPGTVNWAYNLLPEAAQALAVGQSITLTFNVTVTDGGNLSASRPVSITITGSNDGPVAVADTGAATEDGAVINGSVATNDSDVDNGAVLSYSLNAPVAGLTFNPNGKGGYTFDPKNEAYQNLAQGATRDVVANYTVSDGLGGTATSTLTITVTGTNDRPVAVAGTGTTNEDTVFNGQVSATDVDTGATATFRLVDGDPAVPGLTFRSDGSYSFDPRTIFNSLDTGESQTVTFSYIANDGFADSLAPATVRLTITGVNDAPVVVADTASIGENGSVWINVLANDSDPDVEALTASFGAPSVVSANPFILAITSAQLQAAFVTNALGSVDFNPGTLFDSLQASQTATVTLPYTAFDGTVGTPSTLTITLTGVNDAAVITGFKTGSVTEDVPGAGEPSVVSRQLTATDVDDGLIGNAVFQPDTIASAYGSFSIDETGLWSFTLNNSLPLVQSLAEGQVVRQGFTVRTGDGTEARIEVTIVGQEDAPVIIAGGTNLVTNFSFESPESPNVGGFVPVFNIPGWTNLNPERLPLRNDVHEEPGRASTPYGDQWLDTNTSPGTIDLAQAVNVGSAAAGTAFVLSLALARTGGSDTGDGIVIRWGGNIIATITNDQLPTGDGNFQTFSFLVRSGSDAASNTIRLTGLDTNRTDNTGIGIDNVSLVLANSQNGTVTEDGDTPAENAGVQAISGSFNVRDVDQGDDLEITEQFLGASGNGPNGQPLSGMLLDDLRAAFSTSPDRPGALKDIETTGSNSIGGANGLGTAQVTWTYNLPNSAVQYLAAGQTLTLSYVINVTDNFGGTAQQPVTITIVGSNDGVVVAGDSVTSKVYTEFGGAEGDLAGPTGSEALVSLSGVINFTDVDVTDTHTAVTEGMQSFTFLAADGETELPLPQDVRTDLLQGLFEAGAVTESPTTAGGSVGWSYSATDGLFDFLGVGQTLTITQDIRISDGSGPGSSFFTQTVSVIITGTNDRPTVASVNTGEVEALINGETDTEVLDEDDLGDLDGLNLLDLINARDADTGPRPTVADTDPSPDGFKPEITGTVTLNLAAQTKGMGPGQDRDSDLAAGTSTSFQFDISDLLELGAISVDANGNLTIAEGFTDVLGAVLESGDSLVVDAQLTVTDAQGAEATANIDFTVIGNGVSI